MINDQIVQCQKFAQYFHMATGIDIHYACGVFDCIHKNNNDFDKIAFHFRWSDKIVYVKDDEGDDWIAFGGDIGKLTLMEVCKLYKEVMA